MTRATSSSYASRGARTTSSPDDTAEQQPDNDERQRPRRSVDQQGVQRCTAFLASYSPGDVGTADAAMRSLDVEEDSLRYDECPVAGAGCTPPEVDVVAEHGEPVVEPAELFVEVAPHEHPGGVHCQHVAGAVVLTLVVLPALEARLTATGPADRHTDLEQAA
jgi:hypothetical protein